MLLIIDNYDSFTYNLAQYFQILGEETRVFAHDKIDLLTVEQLHPAYIVISPGPKDPKQAGISLELIKKLHPSYPILGVCLGHQCLAEAFGGQIIQAPEIMHGKTSNILHHHQGLFKNIANGFRATRYHSLAVDPKTLPRCFSIDAWAKDSIMAISHRSYPLFGLQFHPEAILTEYGLTLLENFLKHSR